MRRALASTALSLALLAPLGCGGEQQPAEFDLYHRDPNTITLELKDVSDWYTDTVNVGPAANPVPIEVQWKSAFDDKDCERVQEIKIRRTGGDTSTIVTAAASRGQTRGCNPGDTQKYEELTVDISFETGGAKTTHNVVLRGDGTLDGGDKTL